jgi:hypothetical protein
MPEHPLAMPNGYVKRANLVMENVLGRPLRRGEEVHHKNRVKTDDSPGNLELHTATTHAQLHGAERRKIHAERASQAPKSTRPPTSPPRRIAWPPVEQLRDRVAVTSLRVVAKEIGCSHVALYFQLHPEKKR